MATFNLTDYMSEINAIMSNQSCTPAEAVAKFIVNLTTMREHNKGTGTLNYHQLGQQWNSLGYTEKNSQRDAALREAKKPKDFFSGKQAKTARSRYRE